MRNEYFQSATRLVRRIGQLHVSVYAAHTSFFLVLSLFPSLVLLLSLLRYTGLDVSWLTDLLEGVIPNALLPAAKKLIHNAYRGTTGMVVSVSAVTALWSASRGVYGLLTGLNSIYGVREDRGYVYTRLICAGYTVVFLLMLLLTLLLQVFGVQLLQWLRGRMGALPALLSEVVGLRVFVLLAAQTALFTAMFRVLPNRRSRWREGVPGALLAAAGWLSFSNLYSIYVTQFASYATVYGPVYAVALSMLWLYCCISIVFYGGLLNRYLASGKFL